MRQIDISPDARKQLDAFIERYSPEIAARGRAILEKMRELLPGAVELVYDNYNALAIGFAADERPSSAAFSIVFFPRWVTLFFLRGAELLDPKKLLKGSGNVVRRIELDGPHALDDPGLRALMAQALARSAKPIDDTRPGRVVIRSVSEKRRPRRPTATGG